MSHVVTIQTKIHDPQAVIAACRRLSLAEPVQGTAQLYGGEVSGFLVQLTDWRYPIVIDTLTGSVHYDNYGGAWGEPQRLSRFMQIYAVEKSRLSQCTSC